MKKIFYVCTVICLLVSLAFSFIMDFKNLKDLIKTLLCSLFAGGLAFLFCMDKGLSAYMTILLVCVASGYARPVVFGVNKVLKEFFKDPKGFIDRFKDKSL